MINGRAGVITCSITSLMTKTEMVLETLVYPPVNHLMWLLGQENFIEFFFPYLSSENGESPYRLTKS